MIPVEMLKSGAAAMNIELTDTQLAQFDLYASLLVEWNQKIAAPRYMRKTSTVFWKLNAESPAVLVKVPAF